MKFSVIQSGNNDFFGMDFWLMFKELYIGLEFIRFCFQDVVDLRVQFFIGFHLQLKLFLNSRV